jgi:hypothetical protein
LLLHDNALAHWALATQKKLAYMGFHCYHHPLYSPDLVPSVYYLFPGQKKQLKGQHFCPMQWSLLPRDLVEWLAKVRATG